MSAFVALLKMARLKPTIPLECSCGPGRVPVPPSATTLKWCFGQEVSLFILLQEKLKEK